MRILQYTELVSHALPEDGPLLLVHYAIYGYALSRMMLVVVCLRSWKLPSKER